MNYGYVISFRVLIELLSRLLRWVNSAIDEGIGDRP